MGDKPRWIIRRASASQPILWANGIDGSARWVAFGFLFPLNEQYPKTTKLAHFSTSKDADAEAFQRIAEEPGLAGMLSVEECWVKRCKVCYDCLCGEGGRNRE